MRPSIKVKLSLQATRYKLVNLYTTQDLEIQILLYLFVTCDRYGVIFKRYILQTKQVYPFETYSPTLYLRGHSLKPTKVAKLTLWGKPGLRKQKIYKRQESQRQKINCFSSAFVSFCFLLHFFSFFTFLLKDKDKV